ncbi:hypothetical protein M426DRAFT_267562 [Hypoxylon sp. CI-4A]|nr:hypothetical protein M426DRAFT_267562 [Hypoxylon sp. CI-4A]
MSGRYNHGFSVYNPRPYHVQPSSIYDEPDDDICVWKDGPLLSDLDDEDGESYDDELTVRFREPTSATDAQAEKEVGKDEAERDVAATTSSEDMAKLTQALSTTRKNLTRISQFILKLEARAGKVAKEGIRQTLDATVANTNNTSDQDNHDPNHLEDVEELRLLSQSVWHRLYLVDRHWRRQSRLTQDTQGQSPKIPLEGESSVKGWLKEEIRIHHLSKEDTCYFTVADLADGRQFEDWIVYLKVTCEFKDDPSEESKLIDLAWQLLDRDLRGPRPTSSTRIGDFVVDLQEKHESGAFDEALKDPKRQERDDAEAWKTIKKSWSSRVQH